MSVVSITIENLSKQYRLGVVGTGTLAHDLKRWWAVSYRGRIASLLEVGTGFDPEMTGYILVTVDAKQWD